MGTVLKPGDSCPRCHMTIDFLERKRVRGQVYLYAWHYLKGPDGKRKIKKCYLGPEHYIHGRVTHEPMGIDLKGMGQDLEDIPRYSEYLMNVAQALRLKMQDRTLPSIHARAIAQALEGLAALIEPLRQYAEEKAKEEAEAVNEAVAKSQPLEAPSTASQPQAASTQAEDIDRELKELLKELKASQ